MDIQKTPLFNFKGEIVCDFPFFAHRTDNLNIPKETLEEHLNNSLHYLKKLDEDKGLSRVFERFLGALIPGKENRELLRETVETLFVNMIYCHDLGKINPEFQRQKMDNGTLRLESNDSRHSIYSAMIYFDYGLRMIDQFEEDEESYLMLLHFLIMNVYVIAKHHGRLDKASDFFESFDKRLDIYMKDLSKGELSQSEIQAYRRTSSMLNKLRKESLEEDFDEAVNEISDKTVSMITEATDWYIYTRFSFGILTACDFYSTGQYMNQRPVDSFNTLEKVSAYRDRYEARKIPRIIRDNKTKNKQSMNGLRSALFLESERELLKHSDSNLFFLEAPTGGGKTNISIDLALSLVEKNKELNRVVYVFPFNTLAEQTNLSIMENLGIGKDNVEIGVINSITPIKKFQQSTSKNDEGEWEKTKKEKADYEASLIAREFMHYPIVLTSHVKFFECLFGTRREDCFPLVQLMNSVIIIDEIQSYKNQIWTEIILFLKSYAHLLNLKIIIMSATLPHLDLLMQSNTPKAFRSGITYLIDKPERYNKNPVFAERVVPDFSLLKYQDRDGLFDVLADKIFQVSENQKKDPNLRNLTLVEFIKKKSAKSFYFYLKEHNDDPDLTILLLTGDDNRAERQRIIRMIKDENNTNIILVATQLIEAGVDIDMDTGFKNISIFDAEEQFLGRINRNNKQEKATAYFFQYDPPTDIYKPDKDVRAEQQLQISQPEIQEYLKNKEFGRYYEQVLKLTEQKNLELNANNLVRFYKNEVLWLNFREVEKHMSLIDADHDRVQLFLNVEVEDEDGNILSGKDVWTKYKSLLKNQELKYAEKNVKLSEIRSKMNYFIYEISKRQADAAALVYNDLIGDMYYLEDGSQFFQDGKFNFDRDGGEDFL